MTKSYTDRILFREADFSIQDGDKIGVIGINGTGKTTLLKITAGLEEPDQGRVTRGSQVHVRYLPQNPVFDKGSTILEAVLKNNRTKLNEWSVESEAKSILNRLGLSDFHKKVHTLSGGQRKRAALAGTLLAACEILVLDEPTNHLDNEMAGWLEDYLGNLKSALLMVTHDRYFLDRVSNRIIEIDQGQIYGYSGNYSEYVRRKAERQNNEVASERKRQSLLRTELEWLGRGARARSTKQKAHIQRIEELKERKGPVQEQRVEMSSVTSRLGRKTVELESLSKSYGDHLLFKDFHYILLKGDRIGIVGRNGCGKSTLLRIINHITDPDEGQVIIGQTVKIGYFSQESEYMDEALRVIDYIREAGEYVMTTDGSITASQMLERFLFDGTMQYAVIGKLSGGEKRRLYLLRVLMESPNVLLLDEPTNDLDIQTLTILEDYLDRFDGIVVAVSHDRFFLDRVVRRIFAFEENGAIRQYEGGFSDYCESFRLKAAKKEPEQVKGTGDTREREKKLKFTFLEDKEFRLIDEDIAVLEAQIQELNKQIECSASDYGMLRDLMEQKADVETELEHKMERWVYLTDLAERIQEERADQ